MKKNENQSDPKSNVSTTLRNNVTRLQLIFAKELKLKVQSLKGMAAKYQNQLLENYGTQKMQRFRKTARYSTWKLNWSTETSILKYIDSVRDIFSGRETKQKDGPSSCWFFMIVSIRANKLERKKLELAIKKIKPRNLFQQTTLSVSISNNE